MTELRPDDLNAIRAYLREDRQQSVPGGRGTGELIQVTDEDVVGVHAGDAAEERLDFFLPEPGELDGSRTERKKRSSSSPGA